MNHIGIDLGTTNSAICSYDGKMVRLHKSPEQNDVTPSAIYFDRRGNKFLGKRAYDSAAKNPKNAALKFKRMMGSGTVVKIASTGKELTPEECSAEIIKLCFGYIPEDIRQSGVEGAVITIPAAFNQMQRNATLAAAKLAGLPEAALLQEPVAAVMSIMRRNAADGVFMVLDLGGGTLDVAIAQKSGGKVSLLSHGGVEMLGGADYDLAMARDVAAPWLKSHFDLPEDFANAPQWRPLMRMVEWACERAKIDLSSSESAVISLSEDEIGLRDAQGEEIYIDCPIDRAALNKIIAPSVDEIVEAAGAALARCGLKAEQIDRIVFIGGPTQYKPLRDAVSGRLKIKPAADANPMTAVCEGAAIFAESIDWKSKGSRRKSVIASAASSGAFPLTLSYRSRVAAPKAMIMAKIDPKAPQAEGAEFQIDSLDTGWTSGRLPLKDEATVEAPLDVEGPNVFAARAFASDGSPLDVGDCIVSIVRAPAVIYAIPAASSIGVEVKNPNTGLTKVDFLVMAGEALPKTGSKTFLPEIGLKKGSADSIKFKLWEGDFVEPPSDNRFIGMFEIKGSDLSDPEAEIRAGDALQCDYEVAESGAISFKVRCEAAGQTFHSGNGFYSRAEAQIDYAAAKDMARTEIADAWGRIERSERIFKDSKLDRAKDKLEKAESQLKASDEAEVVKKAMDLTQDAKKLIASARRERINQIRWAKFTAAMKLYNDHAKANAGPEQASAVESLARRADNVRDKDSGEMKTLTDGIKAITIDILMSQPEWIAKYFKILISKPGSYPDKEVFESLRSQGARALKAGDDAALGAIVAKLRKLRVTQSDQDDFAESANIVSGGADS